MKTEALTALREFRPGHRRHFTTDEKRALLLEAYQRRESLSALGRRYDIAVSLLFRWRRELAIAAHEPPSAPEIAPDVPPADELERKMVGLESQLQYLLDENRRLMARIRRLERFTASTVAASQTTNLARSGVRDQV